MKRIYPEAGVIRGFFSVAFFSTLYFLFSIFYFISPAHAALLYFDPQTAEIHKGDSVTVALRLDTDEGECVNTVSAVVHFDPSVRAIDVSRGESILSLWVEQPRIDEAQNTVTFSGGLPAGYCGRIPGDPSLTNVVLEIVFRSPSFSIGGSDNKSARIWLDDLSTVLLHDGTGDPAPLRKEEAVLTLLSTPGSTPTDEWRGEVQSDKDLPSDFAITLARDESAFSGKYFITFNASDKQSGIDHYEVMEEPITEFGTFTWGRADAPWIRTESPYVLTDQTLNSTIRVKVVDKAGNSRIETLVPDPALRSISRDRLITLIVVGGTLVALGLLVFYALWRRRQRILEEIVEEEKL